MSSIIQIKVGNKMMEGQVTYAEGDLLEATFPERIDIAVGQPLSCLVTRNYEELYTFDGVVLGREENKLYIFNSPTISEYREQRRRYPRFDVNAQGWIQILDKEHAPASKYSFPIVDIMNVSLGGIAFRLDRHLPAKTKLILHMELLGKNDDEGEISASCEVIHVQESAGSFHHGCKVTNITGKNLHKLRKFLLQRQLGELKVR